MTDVSRAVGSCPWSNEVEAGRHHRQAEWRNSVPGRVLNRILVSESVHVNRPVLQGVNHQVPEMFSRSPTSTQSRPECQAWPKGRLQTPN